MNKKFIWLIVSCLMVAALVLASCAPKVVEEKEATVVTKEPEKKVEEVEEKPAVVGPQYGGTLTISTVWSGDFPIALSWDTITGNYFGSHYYTSPYQEYLLAGDVSRGLTGTGEHTFGGRYIPPELLRGELAESWELTTDPLAAVFHLRQGVYWQGKPGVMGTRELTADDVVFSIQRRLADPLCPVPTPWVGTVTATDRYTVVVELLYPYPEWENSLGWGQCAPVAPPELYEAGIEDWRNAVGTGPFMLTDYIASSLVVYTRNPDYWGTTVIDGKEYQIPFVDRLEYPIIADEATQLAALRTGKIDIWEKAPWVYVNSLADSNPELRIWEVEGWSAYELSLRQDSGPPLDILNVRRALSMAIDRQYIMDDLYGGYGVMLNYPFPPSWGEIHTPLEQQPPEVQEAWEYNPEKAKQMLADAGYPDGFKVKGLIRSIPLEVSVMSLLKDNWADVGVEIELEAVEAAAFWGRCLAMDFTDIAGRFEDGPTPGGMLRIGFQPGAAGNECAWDDATFVDLYDRWSVETNADEQLTLLKAMSNRVLYDSPIILLPGPNHFRYAYPWVKNYEGEAGSSYASSVEIHSIIWLDQTLKAEMGY